MTVRQKVLLEYPEVKQTIHPKVNLISHHSMGKKLWNVWFTRFKEIVHRRGWTHEDKLIELLPKLQGEAESFVFDQLCSKNPEELQRTLP